MKCRFKDRITGTGSGDQAPSSVAIQFSKYNFGMKNINKKQVLKDSLKLSYVFV